MSSVADTANGIVALTDFATNIKRKIQHSTFGGRLIMNYMLVYLNENNETKFIPIFLSPGTSSDEKFNLRMSLFSYLKQENAIMTASLIGHEYGTSNSSVVDGFSAVIENNEVKLHADIVMENYKGILVDAHITNSTMHMNNGKPDIADMGKEEDIFKNFFSSYLAYKKNYIDLSGSKVTQDFLKTVEYASRFFDNNGNLFNTFH